MLNTNSLQWEREKINFFGEPYKICVTVSLTSPKIIKLLLLTPVGRFHKQTVRFISLVVNICAPLSPENVGNDTAFDYSIT